ncbi:MAG: DUF6531 domain-containing protein, partial [Verrucomicrobiota bacterium]
MLHKSEDLGAFKAVDMQLGAPGAQLMRDTEAVEEKAFYVVERIPLSSPRDQDKDGMDDIYELLRPGLDPTDPTDGRADFDNDGRTEYEVYTLESGRVPDDLRIETMKRNGGKFTVTFASQPGYYYLLRHSTDLSDFSEVVAMTLGFDGQGILEDTARPDAKKAYYQLQRIPIGDSIDVDGDKLNDLWELQRPQFLNPLVVNDLNDDPDENGLSHAQEQAVALGNLTIITPSPTDGETGVAVTRETILRFSNPLAIDTTVNTDMFFATFGGERLGCRVELSTDRLKATLFYDEVLPPNSRITVHFEADEVADEIGLSPDGDGDGEPGGEFITEFDTLTLTALADTAVCGRVYASDMEMSGGGQMVNCPLPGVVITVDGKEGELTATTDAMGNFRLQPAPVGRFFVHIDGRTTTLQGIPPGAYYPFVGKTWESVAGTDTNIGNVYLPLVPAGALDNVSSEDDTVVTFTDSVIQENPELADVALTVPANSLFSDDGTRGGQVGIAPVDPDRLPGALPPGLEFPLVITVQTDGPTNFDRPIPICFPNLPDPATGQPLPPGAKTALWSFDHDIGRFLIAGSMTVSEDGTMICSDPGVGVLAPGWHGTSQGSSGGGDCLPPDPMPPECKPGSDPDSPEDEQCEKPDDGGGMGDPVMLATGEFVQEETDMVIKGRGFDFRWDRRYSSREGYLTAQGHNWDFNYNISIIPSGRIMRLRHGNANEDPLHQTADGSFGRREFFLNLVRNPDDTWTLSHPDKSEWRFHPCDDPADPVCGKIERMVDRNGNTMRFEYNALGQLSRIIDTLDRNIDVAYNADGFIESVTDFTGRQCSYEYYAAGEPGGNFGDLKAFISPRVTGTPNGNDFPDGKKRTYTYSAGYSDENRNHNLLTITDGRRNDP